MSSLDIAIAGVLALSVAWGVWRGFVRELISLAGWVLAFLAANAAAGPLGDALPTSLTSPELRVLLAYLVVFVFTLSIATIVGLLLSRVIKAYGLGGLDRTLGGLFGLARGVVVLLALTVLAGLTTLPRQALWRTSVGAGMLERTVVQLKPWLPPRLGDRLRYH
ncbi:MAG TPA: CvpA family protein [Burkholderiales bacterium]|nr:CvpA family protein [Burkholderiales bacterium]